MIDRHGFRLNVGIILCNSQGKLLWARRISRQNAWQFPQGGIWPGETAKDAMYRELSEELGLEPDDVEYISHTRYWLFYRLPKKFIRHDKEPLCIGQKQKWFLLLLKGDDSLVRLDYSPKPEFAEWRWVDYWYPLQEVISFKRAVYRRVLSQFASLIPGGES